jgi:hypothetical protein
MHPRVSGGDVLRFSNDVWIRAINDSLQLIALTGLFQLPGDVIDSPAHSECPLKWGWAIGSSWSVAQLRSNHAPYRNTRVA